MARTFSPLSEASVEAMGDHFEVMHVAFWNGDVHATVQQIIDYFHGIGQLVPWGKIVAILAPVAMKIWAGQPVDWAAVVDALLGLIPAPPPPVVDPTIP